MPQKQLTFFSDSDFDVRENLTAEDLPCMEPPLFPPLDLNNILLPAAVVTAADVGGSGGKVVDVVVVVDGGGNGGGDGGRGGVCGLRPDSSESERTMMSPALASAGSGISWLVSMSMRTGLPRWPMRTRGERNILPPRPKKMQNNYYQLLNNFFSVFPKIFQDS